MRGLSKDVNPRDGDAHVIMGQIGVKVLVTKLP